MERRIVEKAAGKISALLVLAYLCVLGGIVALTVFTNTVIGLTAALALVFMFGLAGLASFVFYGIDHRRRGWQILGVVSWLAALFVYSLHLSIDGLLDPALLLALYAFTGAGVFLYYHYHPRRADARPLNARVEWEKLGKKAEPDPAERDLPRAA